MPSALIGQSRAADAWFSAGLASAFPDITDSGSVVLSGKLPCKLPCKHGQSELPGCKVFHVPRGDGGAQKPLTLDEAAPSQVGDLLQDQVLVFKYRGKFHAVDNKCPHSSYPLSDGTPFDIEDFGLVLSAGLTCPKHGWSFDLFTGNADRSRYRLEIWDVQLGPRTDCDQPAGSGAADERQEVWVRRKQRMG